jgi:hypothetical protein
LGRVGWEGVGGDWRRGVRSGTEGEWQGKDVGFKSEPNLRTPTKDEIKERNDLLPKKTKALSWKRIYQTGIYYIIELSEKGYVLEMSQSQNKGHWEMDPAKRLLFNRQTDLSVIIQAILNDIEKRSK